MTFLSLDFSFLKSTRFWKLVIVAILQVLISLGIIQGDLVTIIMALESVLGISIVIRTVDRFAEKAGTSDTK